MPFKYILETITVYFDSTKNNKFRKKLKINSIARDKKRIVLNLKNQELVTTESSNIRIKKFTSGISLVENEILWIEIT